MTAEKPLVLNQNRPVLKSDGQISVDQNVELALEDADARVLLEKLLVRLNRAKSRYPLKKAPIHPG